MEMVLKSVKSVRKGEGDYGGKDLWKRLSLSLELKKEEATHGESGDEGDDEVV